MKHILYIIITSLLTLFVMSCKTKINTSEASGNDNDLEISNSTVNIFDTQIHADELTAIKELSTAGILKCNSIDYENGRFRHAMIEFAGVKFCLNKGFVFITSEQDQQTIDALVSKISSYYGDPYVDGSGDSVYDYYHWNLSETSSEKPYIKIRPLHSDEGGLVMTWNISSSNKKVVDSRTKCKSTEKLLILLDPPGAGQTARGQRPQ